MSGSVKERKIALMGFRSVGKSSLAIQFVEGQFVDSYDPTIENTFKKTVNVKNSGTYDLLLVDTAGQDEYSIFPSEYSVDIHGYVLVYSIDSRQSFNICEIIHEKMLDLMDDLSAVPIVLVGNKSDLHNERRVTVEEGKELAKQMKAFFLETSAKENQNVGDIFNKVIASETASASGGGSGPDKEKAKGDCSLM